RRAASGERALRRGLGRAHELRYEHPDPRRHRLQRRGRAASPAQARARARGDRGRLGADARTRRRVSSCAQLATGARMTAATDHDLPTFETVLLARSARLLTLTLQRPESLNAFDARMHQDLVDALAFAASDEASDVLLLTGAGRAFSAGGDLAYMAENA